MVDRKSKSKMHAEMVAALDSYISAGETVVNLSFIGNSSRVLAETLGSGGSTDGHSLVWDLEGAITDEQTSLVVGINNVKRRFGFTQKTASRFAREATAPDQSQLVYF